MRSSSLRKLFLTFKRNYTMRLQANMLIGFDIETPSTFVLTFSLSDFLFCSGLKTQH
uniref:Uncharacterized protein n=1 Tax=Populus trichocarpa TaxID=3694 RepID=A0A3N7F9K3_POPTR